MSFLLPKPYGSVHGRFQGLHLDHEEYILRLMAKYAHLFVGLALPNPNGLSKESPQSRRHDPANNPFSYYERTQMLRGCMRNKEDFSSLVSPSVKQVIEQLGLDRELAEQSAG